MIHPRQKRSLENLAAYLIRSSFSQQRMEYLPDQAKVVYCSKDRKEKITYDALEWMAATVTLALNFGEWFLLFLFIFCSSSLKSLLQKISLIDYRPLSNRWGPPLISSQ